MCVCARMHTFTTILNRLSLINIFLGIGLHWASHLPQSHYHNKLIRIDSKTLIRSAIYCCKNLINIYLKKCVIANYNWMFTHVFQYFNLIMVCFVMYMCMVIMWDVKYLMQTCTYIITTNQNILFHHWSIIKG